MVFFCITMYFVIHQATQNLNYGPVMQNQGHQSMCIGTALFKLWFPVLVFRNLVWCFPGLRQIGLTCFSSSSTQLIDIHRKRCYYFARVTLSSTVRPCAFGLAIFVRSGKSMLRSFGGTRRCSPSPVRLAKDDGYRSCRRRRTSRVGDGAQNYRRNVDLVVKDGFSAMDAVELLDKEDLSQSKYRAASRNFC